MNPIPLYDLLTDKEGSPLPPDPRAHAARVGWKERMGPGRPAVVLDKETQEPLVVNLHDSHGNFVRAVDNRPGHYVLVILDEHHSALGKELVGHITVSAPRNAAPEAITSGDPVLLRMLALVERAMDRAMDLAACTVEHHAGTVTANADVIRANAEATRTTHGLAARNAAPIVAPESGDDDEDDAREPTAIESVAYQCLTAVDVWWETRNARKKSEAEEVVKKADAPKAAPAAVPPASPSPSSPPPAAESATKNAAPSDTAPTAPEPAPTTPTPEPAPTPAKVVLTPEQGARMQLVMAKLNKREQLAAQGMVMRLSEAERAQWLEEFSALTVDQAVERIREFMPDKAKGGAK
jgi:cell division septation protein DedD